MFVNKKEFSQYVNQIKSLEEKLRFIDKKVLDSDLKSPYVSNYQSINYNGLHLCFCADTKDPLKQNRIRFYSPMMHNPKTTSVDQLPWAYPISPFGGFDDCGVSWVPPAGTMVALMFENGDRERPYYIGSTWHRSRGEFPYVWGYGIPEFDTLWAGKRDGYASNVGKNNIEVFPPHNTENYNGIDIDSETAFEKDDEAKDKLTYAHIYSITTPGKHRIKLNDGDPKCNNKWKSFQLFSSRGQHFIFKDDHLHPAGQDVNPEAGCGGGDETKCDDKKECISDVKDKPKCANPYSKRLEEGRPYRGPGTPQNNKCELPQSGIQLLSFSGITFGMDDSVEQPTGAPDWHDALQPFSFGCTNKAKCKTFWISTTGHKIEMSDDEEESEIRSENNYIKILSASGNKIELNDHTVSGCIAGTERGVKIESTSKHLLHFCDQENEQCSPTRREGGVPDNNAKQAFVLLRSGYGLTLKFSDDNNQKQTDQQNITMISPQKDNTERGPHVMRMQEKPSGPGYLFLRAGGVYYTASYDESVEVVGVPDEHPANKIVIASQDYYCQVDNNYIRITKSVDFVWAERYAFLLAGKDCDDIDGNKDVAPCVYPAVVAREPWCCPIFKTIHWTGKAVSDRVFLSHSSEGGSHYCG